jgi:hypothetical protein
MRRIVLPLALAGLALSGAACTPQDPCRVVPPADQALIQQANQRPDIEFETEGEHDAECVLINGRWVDEASLAEDHT